MVRGSALRNLNADREARTSEWSPHHFHPADERWPCPRSQVPGGFYSNSTMWLLIKSCPDSLTEYKINDKANRETSLGISNEDRAIACNEAGSLNNGIKGQRHSCAFDEQLWGLPGTMSDLIGTGPSRAGREGAWVSNEFRTSGHRVLLWTPPTAGELKVGGIKTVQFEDNIGVPWSPGLDWGKEGQKPFPGSNG